MKSMEIMLEQARMTLNTAASDPQVLAILTRHGYDAEQLQAGMALCQAARDSLQLQGVARFSKVSATQILRQHWKMAMFHYHNDIRIARMALKQYSGSRYFLQLDSTHTKAFDEWHAQASDFYVGLRNQPELQTEVGKLGLTAERVEQGIQSLQTLADLRLQQKSQMGSASSTRQQRDQSLQAFNRWMSTFRQFARLALAFTPHYLATLGLEPQARKATKKIEGIRVEMPTLNPVNLLAMA